MRSIEVAGRSLLSAAAPIRAAYERLEAVHPAWRVQFDRQEGPGWLRGTDLRCAGDGPFNTLLLRLGAKLGTTDRRTIAGSFALRYGQTSGVAIAPYVVLWCVPNVALDNMSFRFNDKLNFEMAALHRPQGAMLAGVGSPSHDDVEFVTDASTLLDYLRRGLLSQATDVIRALYDWSRFSERAMWGLVASSWAAQFGLVLSRIGRETQTIEMIRRLFDNDDAASRMQPTLCSLSLNDRTAVYQRHKSCCRFYLLAAEQFCMACPLLPEEEGARRYVDLLNRTEAKATP